jgi:hypothetical protein
VSRTFHDSLISVDEVSFSAVTNTRIIPRQLNRVPTFDAVRAQKVGTLDLTTAWALDEVGRILEGLAGHLAMALLHMGGLLLGDGTQDRFPQIRQNSRDVEGD